MAYAALNSLRITPMSHGLLDILKITESERDESVSLLSMLERLDDECYRGIDRSEIHELEAKITEAAWKLEDVIESFQLNSQGLDEEGVEQESHSFFKTAKKLRDEYERVLENSCVAEEDHIIHEDENSTTVGLSDLYEEITSQLLVDDPEEIMFPIWGMAGIGKTHLARYIYHHPLIAQRFELKLWVHIGPNHKDIKNIYVDILAQILSQPRDLLKEKDERELKDLLFNSLHHRTYLIVLDDVWSKSVLTNCKYVLPIGSNHKIIVTTRLSDVAGNRFRWKIWEMPFLSNEESWDLLSKIVFGEETFPTQLEKPGRKIAEICEGLPLLILVVADILRGLDQTEEYWNMVADKKTTTFPDAYDRIYKVLVSSYDYLPQKYKAHFLYMGVFRQSLEIFVSKLYHLWSVEGFNEGYYKGGYIVLKEFISSCLAIICRQSTNFTIKSYKLHCTYWYVCVTEARKTNLFHVLNKLTDASIERPCRLCIQNNMLFEKEVYDSMAAATSLTRSLLFTGEDHPYPVHVCFETMLMMRVLDALTIRFYEFPNEVLNLLHLRYLALTHNGKVPSSISKFQRLRYLILCWYHNIKLVQRESTIFLPNEIWDLQELWYLRIMGSNLPDPRRAVELPKLSRLYVYAIVAPRVFSEVPLV